ncbi:MAG: peptidase M19, partial [Octadecabacter sp.]
MRRLKQALLGFMGLLVSAIVAFLVFAPAYVERSRNVITSSQLPVPSAAAQSLHETLTIGDWHADPLLW